MHGWMKDRTDPESWTPDRVLKLRALDTARGDIEVARRAWAAHTREQFLAFQVEHGRFNEWEQRNDD